MYRVMQKYQKKLLAIFAVLLMIAFVATLGYRPGGGARGGDVIVGHMGKIPIYDSEMRVAKDDWQILKNTPFVMQGGSLPFPAVYLPPSLMDDIDKHPELFLLLQKEALDLGVRVDDERAKEALATYDPYVDVTSPSQRVTETIAAVRRLLLAAGGIERLGESIKISQPVGLHAVAQTYQQARLNLVEFRADQYDKSVAPPTPAQLRQQFERYRDNPPGQTSTDNPLGFGYQIPTRVKLQYVEIPRAQVLDAVRGNGDKLYDWEVKAAGYYDTHKEEFRNPPPTTHPTTAATTQATNTTQPATDQATSRRAAEASASPATAPDSSTTEPAAVTQPAASQPAIKPFAQVKEQIIEKLAAPDVQKLSTAIENDVIARLTRDWTEIRQSDPAATRPATTESATAPASQAVVATSTQPAEPQTTSVAATQASNPLMGLAELEKIRAEIQGKYQVAIELHEIAGAWQTTRDLEALPGIGSSDAPDGNAFPEYATSFAGGGGISLPAPLQVWEPSPPLTDSGHNVYLFRLTAAEPAHAPASDALVAKQVEQDWRTAQGYERAREAAHKLEETAKSAGLSQAALPGGEALLTATAGPFGPIPRFIQSFNDRISGYEIKDAAARRAFAKAAQSLLAAATPEDRHPAAELDLPAERKAVVMELTAENLFPLFSNEEIAEQEVVQQERGERLRSLLGDWFSYPAVVARLGYKAEKT